MTQSWIILILGISLGIALGAGVAGLALMQRPKRWTIILRMPKALHHRLRHEAKGRMQSVSGEIIERLKRSVDKDRHR
jgi:hypothetical protein